MIIYTCITNNYSKLPEKMPSGNEYICYGEAEQVGPWEVRPGMDLGDPVRSSRYYKINCPFEESIYVDATRLHLLKEPFFAISQEILTTYNDKLFVLQHPHKHSYLNEMMEYYNNGWWSKSQIMHYTYMLKEIGFDFRRFFSPMCTILWRRKCDKFNKTWWEWYQQGGVRDQVSFATALQQEKMIFRFDGALNFLNNFTNAEFGGEWWDVKQGDYSYHKPEDSEEMLRVLCNLSGLSSFRYKPCCRRRSVL